jgi:hypothetical protein
MFKSLLLSLLLPITMIAQKNASKYSISGGLGLAGSFFVRSYEENQLGLETSFFKKNFIGKGMYFSVERKLRNNFRIGVGYSFQQFKRRVKYSEEINNVLFFIDHSITHTNHIYDVSLKKQFDQRKSFLTATVGIYYLRPIQEEIDITRTLPRIVTIEDRSYRNGKLEEAGVLVGGSYEYNFQPRVNFGIQSNFYFTVSTGEPESITLIPYIRILF